MGVPRVRWYGRAKNYNCLVMDLLGPSLEDVFNRCDRQFSLKTVLMLADQMVTMLCLPLSNTLTAPTPCRSLG